ncbi:MAG: hypothetical protein JXB13_09955 [Phycisphaerae bacterium]|nr:hypothetical protein [Phycisphaerae bacterium]
MVTVAGVGFAYWRAWVADDAFITFRHVANCLAGHGPVYNVGERVQAFTHPLWFLLLLAGATVANVYAVAVTLGIAATGALLGAVGLFLRHGRQPVARLLLVALLLLGSHTFVEYQTSGLETGLSHLLVAVLWGWLLREIEHGRPIPVVGPAVLCAMLILNRPDHVILCALPVLGLLVVALRRHKLGGLLRLAPAAALLIAWYGFATVYYGTPFPNTAYAKIGLAQPLLWHWGFAYLRDYAYYEPLQTAFIALAVPVTIAAGIRDLLARRRGAGMLLCLTLAVVLHVAYVVHMGGDFMRGRVLGVALVAGVLLGQHLIGRWLPDRSIARPCLLALGLVGLAVCAGEGGRIGGLAALKDGLLRISDQARYTPIRTAAGVASLIALLVVGLRVFSRKEYSPWAARVYATTVLVLGVYALAAVGQHQPHWADAAVLVSCIGVVTYVLSLFVSRRAVRFSPGFACLILPLAAGITLSDLAPRTAWWEREPGITDEYTWYAASRTAPRFREPEPHPRAWARQWANEGHMVHSYTRAHGPITVFIGPAGLLGYHAGPDVHVVDWFGLTDPFVARCAPHARSRIGHLRYEVPTGYLESLGAVNLLPDWEQRLRNLDPSLAEDAREMARNAQWTDPEARRRYDQTKLVVRGKIWSKERWTAIPDFAWPIR